MRRSSGSTAVVLAVAALAAGGGCGNTSDEPASTAAGTAPPPARAPLTKAQFVRATAKICAETDRDIGAFIPLGTDPATRRANRTGIIAVIRKQNEAIRALGYPIGARRADLDAVYRDVDAVLDRAATRDTVDIEKAIDDALAPYTETLAEFTPGCQ